MAFVDLMASALPPLNSIFSVVHECSYNNLYIDISITLRVNFFGFIVRQY
jgi:hypothetical protein